MRSAPTFSTNPPASSDVPQVLLDAGHREDDARVRRACARSVLERVDGGEVHLGVGLGVEQEPLDACVPAPGRRPPSARLGEVVGVGEEERRVVAVDDEAGHLRGLRVVVDVVHAGDVRHVAEDAVVRVDDAPQQVEHRQRDGRPRCRGARRRRARRRSSRAPARARCAGSARSAATRRRRRAGSRRRRRRRPAPRSGRPAMTGPRHSRVAMTRTRETRECSWRAAAHGVGDHRAAAAAADREALRAGRPRVGRAEGEELLVAVDGLAVAGGEGAGGQHVVGVGRRRDAERGERAGAQVDVADVGQRQGGRPRRHAPDDRDPGSCEVEDARRPPSRQQHRDQRPGQRGGSRWKAKSTTSTPATGAASAGARGRGG